MDGWNTLFLLGWPIFRGEMLVSGSVVCLFVYLNRFFQVLYTLNILLTQTAYYILPGDFGKMMVLGYFQQTHSLIISAGLLKEDLDHRFELSHGSKGAATCCCAVLRLVPFVALLLVIHVADNYLPRLGPDTIIVHDRNLGKSLSTYSVLMPNWMSQEVSKWFVNGLQPTYKWGIPWGYNPLTNHWS